MTNSAARRSIGNLYRDVTSIIVVKPTVASITYPGSALIWVRAYRLCCTRMKVGSRQRSTASTAASKSRGPYGIDGAAFGFFTDSCWVLKSLARSTIYRPTRRCCGTAEQQPHRDSRSPFAAPMEPERK